jgi:hypothetical protein
MKKRFLNFSVLLCFVFSVFLVGSCQKKDETPAQTQQEDTNTGLNEVGDAEPTPDLGSGLSGVAIEFSRMIVQDATAYRHFYQKSAITCGGNVCLAASYMMGRGIIYPSKPFSAQELDRIKTGMRTVCSGDPDKLGASITNGYSFARTDIGSCQPPNEWVDRETAKNNIRKWLASGLPVISLVRITAGSQITASGRYNHFVLIVGLDYTVGGVGSVVYFIDPLSRVAEIRQANYTNFLNAMSAASSSSKYNFMPVGCEKDALPVVTPTQTRIIQLSGDLNFGTVNVGQSSVPKTLTIRNTGNSPLTVSGLTLPAGFIGNFNGTVAANSSQTVNITFTPTAQGSFNVYGAVNANQTSGTIDFPLYGIAIQNQPQPISDLINDEFTGNLNWAKETSTYNGGTFQLNNGYLDFSTNGGSMGVQGQGDYLLLRPTYTNMPQSLVNKEIEINMKELLIQSRNGQKENVSCFVDLVDNTGKHLRFGFNGNYSGYDPEGVLPYNTYNKHGLILNPYDANKHNWQILQNLNIGQYYDYDLKLTNRNDKWFFAYKLASNSNWTQIDITNSANISASSAKLYLLIFSGDGGGTTENGIGRFQIGRFQVRNSQ